MSETEKSPLDAFREKYNNYSLLELITELKNLREASDTAEDFYKSQRAVYDLFSKAVVPARMEDEGMEQLTVEGIGRVNIRTDLYCSTKKGMAPNVREWMREHDFEDLITEGINSSTLKAWVKEQMKAANPIPDDMLNIEPFDRAVITKK
jgi:hypothetical protein